MKYKSSTYINVIRVPDLEVHDAVKKVLNRTSRVRHVYRIMIIMAGLTLVFAKIPYAMWTDFWSVIKANGELVTMLLVFSLIAVSLVWAAGQSLDVWVFKVFNVYGHRAPWLDWIMLGITQLGTGVFAMIVAFVIYLKVSEVLAYEIALGTLALWLFVEVLKVIIHRTRPYIKLKKIRIVGTRAKGYSFPSGHTSQSFFLVTLVAHFFHVGIHILLLMYVLALIIGITRIYVGMHYPRDVLGGAVLGTAWGLMGMIVNNMLFS